MEKNKTTLELLKKKDNNNKMNNSHNFLEKVTTNEEQTGLFGKPQIIKKFKLNDNYKHLLSIYALNETGKFSRNMLLKLKSKDMHINTISNFIKEAESKGFIREEKIIFGGMINNLLTFYKVPDKFDDGSICKDGRATYYKITKLGEEISKLNEM